MSLIEVAEALGDADEYIDATNLAYLEALVAAEEDALGIDDDTSAASVESFVDSVFQGLPTADGCDCHDAVVAAPHSCHMFQKVDLPDDSADADELAGLLPIKALADDEAGAADAYSVKLQVNDQYACHTGTEMVSATTQGSDLIRAEKFLVN
jgi:hypothetical protein